MEIVKGRNRNRDINLNETFTLQKHFCSIVTSKISNNKGCKLAG